MDRMRHGMAQRIDMGWNTDTEWAMAWTQDGHGMTHGIRHQVEHEMGHGMDMGWDGRIEDGTQGEM